MNDGIDPRIPTLTEGVIRSMRLLRSLGLDGLGLTLAVAFHDAARPWTARALADYIAFPRTSVLKRLREYEALGLVTKSSEGWIVRPAPQKLLRQLLSEYIDVMGGMRAGFSPEVVEFCKGTTHSAARPSRRKLDAVEALTINFPQGTGLLNYPKTAQ